MEVAGQKRTCLLHLPPAYDGVRSLPLVIAFHGSRGSGKGMAGTTGFSALADKKNFIAAYPDGVVEPGTWNALFGVAPGGQGVTADDVDDVAFTRALIDTLCKTKRADPDRVYVCGFSAGAYMSYRLAVELSDRIAAVGIVNGSLGIKSLDGKPVTTEIPAPLAPVSLIHIAGKQDKAVVFQGRQTPKNLFKSVPDCIQTFVKSNACSTPAKVTTDTAHGVSRTLYTGGKAGTEVELVIVEKCGHEWPGERNGLSASQALWDFFSTHPKAAQK
ncbi:MAG: alpha/beta hydrolase-fold protein [Candidatus Sumerlaeota bacterium]|nr:alpha/beta hydrolase-fold protein [Candidatus Sumerlaeota bacterium]